MSQSSASDSLHRPAEAHLRGEILIPHPPHVEPLTAARNGVIQSSLEQLRSNGFFERYSKHVDPAVLSELSSNLAPGWVRIELVDSHYAACDAMDLTGEELDIIGKRVGSRVRDTSIVVSGKPGSSEPVDVWTVQGQLYRAWSRVYRGGSVQVAKLGPKEGLLDFRGFTLNQYRYFRHANVAAIVSAHEGVGVRIEVARIVRYDAASHDVTIQLVWL